MQYGPKLITNGLILAYDAANRDSFRGVAVNNPLSLYSVYGDTNSTYIKATNGTANVYIPSIGYVNSRYIDFYNDYNGGSGNCCPSLFGYGTTAVSSSTTYTYTIIYKTDTGYTHPNFMYRYESNGSSTVYETGVHSTNNRTSLGDGWWFAWGQFTTTATTVSLTGYLFYYLYKTYDRIYVYRTALYQGSSVIPYEHFPSQSQNRGSTFATGGGWADLSGNGNHAQLVNGTAYSNTNFGSLVFDGSDDYTVSSVTSIPNSSSVGLWIKSSNYDNKIPISIDGTNYGSGPNIYFNSSTINWNIGDSASNPFSGSSYPNSNWHYIVVTNDETSNAKLYIDGVLIGTATYRSTLSSGANNFWVGRFHGDNNYTIAANIGLVHLYSRVLSAAEILTNYNATKFRYQ